MLIEVQKMVNCLRKMQESDSEQYTEQLEDICLDITALNQFRNIMADNNIEEPTRKMAAVFFKNYFMERYSDFDEVFFIELVVSIIMDQRLSYKYKILIQDTVVNMLEWAEKENVVEIIDCLENAFFCLERASGKEFLSLEKKNLKKRSDLDKTKLNLSKYSQFNLQTEEEFINLGYSVIHLVECFSSVESIDTEDLHRVVRISLTNSLTIFPLKNTETCLRLQMVILHMWLGYLEMIDQAKEKKPQLQLIEQEMFDEEYLWKKITQVYEFASFNFTGVQGEQNLLVCAPSESQKKIINKVKNYACEIHLKLLQYQNLHTQKQTFINKTTSSSMFSQIIKTLSYFSVNKQMLAMCSSEQFVNTLLSLFIYVTQQNREIIDTNWTNLLHMIIFPLLTMDEKEFRSFDQEPEEFCRLAEDCCDKQHLGELKTEAARFLEMIADRSLTYCQYAIQFCCLSIQAAIFKNETKIQNTSSLLPLQAAFMTLSILSYNLNRFPLQVSTLNTILLSPQSQQLTQIEASRVFLFLAYNYSEMFKTPVDGKRWVNIALSSTIHHTTRITALDFLLNIVDEYFQEEFLVMFSNKLTDDNEIRQVWDVLNKLLNNHLHRVNEQTMVVLIEKILQRMSSDIIRYKEKQIKTTMNVNSGLELMRKILSNRKYITNKPNVREEILKVIPQYKTFKQLNMEDIILKIINEFMEFSDVISEEFLIKISQIDLVEEFRQDQYRPTPFYWIWNQFVFKEKNLDKIREIKNLLLEGLKSLYQSFLCEKKNVKSNLPIAHSLLILQHILTLHGQKFTPQQIHQIYNFCVMMLPQDINEPQRLNLAPTIIGRTLIIIMLCYMLTNNEHGDKNMLMNPLKYLLLYHDEEGVFVGHNAEVIVKLLCKELFREDDPVSVTEMINIMVRVLRPTQKQPSAHKAKNKSSKKSMKFKLKSQQNYEAILKKIKSPFEFKTSSEQQLRNTLTKMKQNNQLLYKSIISYLLTSIKDKLRDLLATSTLNMNQEGAEKTRRIMKVGGVKSQLGYSVQNDEEDMNGSKKRFKNFDSVEENEVFEEIDENELTLGSNKQDESGFDDGNEEKKGRMKRNKIMKKLKANQTTMQMEKHSKYQ